MIVTLIGSRGCGKSSVGRLLATRLGWEFADADVELEARAGKSIQQIFADDGESAFRDLEEQTITDLLKRERLVLAAGGGAVLRDSTRERIGAAGPVIWLTATPETLFTRIHSDETTAGRRPDLTDQGGLEEVRNLLAQRESIYRESAGLIVDTEQHSVEEIVAVIHEQLLEQEGFVR